MHHFQRLISRSSYLFLLLKSLQQKKQLGEQVMSTDCRVQQHRGTILLQTHRKCCSGAAGETRNDPSQNRESPDHSRDE